jgi:polyribonucleotide 5'-hydroxyl-kinase
MAPSSALPIGATRVVSEMQPVQIDPSQTGSRLLYAVLALLSLPNPDESERYDEEILDLTVTGFLVVYVFHCCPEDYLTSTVCLACAPYSTNVDVPNRKLTILAPNQGSFTGKTAIVGSYEWQDQ